METVGEIISISHDGYGHMWFPFSIRQDERCTIINSEDYRENIDLTKLIQAMFATNNHSSEIGTYHITNQLKNHEGNKETQCSIEFKTNRYEYKITRIFYQNYSFEAKLERTCSTVIYHGKDAIRVLQKMTLPVILSPERSISRSVIMKPYDEYTRKQMLNLVNIWSKMIGLESFRYTLNSSGEWLFYDDSRKRYHTCDSTTPSLVHLLANISQAALRKRKFGYCPQIICTINIEDLNEFEIITILDLIISICKEERLQFLVVTNSIAEIKSDNVLNTPRISIYNSR